MIIKYILLYILLNVLLSTGAFAKCAYNIFFGWLNMIKKGYGIELEEHSKVVIDTLKEKLENNKQSINRFSLIPFKKIIYMYKIINDAYKEAINSENYLDKCHELTEMEQTKIDFAFENYKHLIDLYSEIEESLINPVDAKDIMERITKDSPAYLISGNYTPDEIDYISYITKLKATYGITNTEWKSCILGAIDTDEIKETFPNFEEISVNYDNPSETYKVICMHKPVEKDMCYAITSLILNKYRSKDPIDVEFKEVTSGETIKLTK